MFLQNKKSSVGLTVGKALDIVIKQMTTAGLRPRTISDYETYVKDFSNKTGVESLTDMSADSIYEWLALMNVKPQTKLIHIKCLRAFLGRCYDNGWIADRFWRN